MKINFPIKIIIQMLVALRIVVLTGIPLTFHHSTLFAQEKISVEATKFEGAKVEVMASNLSGVYRFQRSFDAKNWDDLFVMVPDVNNVAFPDPLSDEEQKGFYRLKRFGAHDTSAVSINLDPTDRHLLSYHKGTDLEFHLFGTRDAVGLPKRVESYLFRVGNKTYSGETPTLELAPSASESEFTWTDDDFRHLTGYVFVERNDACPASATPPVVQWRVTEMAPGYSGDPVFGQIQAVPAPEYGEVEGYDVFSYTVPWFSHGYQVPPPVNVEQFANDVFEQWLEDIIIGNQGMSLAGSGLEVMAKRAGTSLNPLLGAGTFLFGTIAATLNARTASQNYDHGSSETFGAFTAMALEVRAIIPNGTKSYFYGTDWKAIASPVLLTEGPDLIVMTPCSQQLELEVGYPNAELETQIWVEADFTRNGSGAGLPREDIKKILDPSPSSGMIDASVQHAAEGAISIAETALTIQPRSIKIDSYGSARHDATRNFIATTMSTGIVLFRIVPTDGLPVGTPVVTELRANHSGGGSILGVSINRVGGNRVTRRTINGAETFNLDVGSWYEFRSDTRLQVFSGGDSYTATYSVEVLGLPRQFW